MSKEQPDRCRASSQPGNGKWKPDVEQRGHAQSQTAGLAHPHQGASKVAKNNSLEEGLDTHGWWQRDRCSGPGERRERSWGPPRI